MTTLIGRECWHTDGGTLLHGKIVSHRLDQNICEILLLDGTKRPVSSLSVILRIEDAVKSCEDKADIWMRRASDLEADMQIRSDAA